jgi:hypothetical protein
MEHKKEDISLEVITFVQKKKTKNKKVLRIMLLKRRFMLWKKEIQAKLPKREMDKFILSKRGVFVRNGYLCENMFKCNVAN